MPVQLQILLFIGAFLALFLIAHKIKSSKILMGDAIFWVLLAVLLVLLAIFPDIAYFFAGIFGFISPSNFVFLTIVALLLSKVLSNSTEISILKHKVDELAQEIALGNEENGSKKAK